MFCRSPAKLFLLRFATRNRRDAAALYFKVHDATRPDFERRGMEPFRPFGEESAMGYYQVPADVTEDVNQLETWMKKAIDVSTKARQRKPKAAGWRKRV